jgi:hypothetical protein
MKLLNFLFIFTVLIIGTVIAQVHFPEEDSNVNHQSSQVKINVLFKFLKIFTESYFEL